MDHQVDCVILDQKALAWDLLSVHLVRNVAENTIISFHANLKLPTTTADYLHKRIRFAGESNNGSRHALVYWINRPKCLLAKDSSAYRRSHLSLTDISLASDVCMGRSPSTSLHGYMCAGLSSPLSSRIGSDFGCM